MPAPAPTKLDAMQAIRGAFDDINGRFRVDAAVSMGPITQEVIISHTNDSIRLGNGTTLFTGTTVGSQTGLDVNVIGGNFTPVGLKYGLAHGEITIGTTPTKIPLVPLVDRRTISVRVYNPTNPDAIVFVGGPGVSAANGYPKFNNEEIVSDLEDDSVVELYGVVASGTAKVRYLEGA